MPLRILVVGEKGAGKTTVCLRAVRALRSRQVSCGGVLCPKIVDESGAVRGIEVLDVADEPPARAVLARTNRGQDGPTTGAYRFSKDGLRFAEKALSRSAGSAAILFADELGPLEMRGEGLTNLLDLARDPTVDTMVIVVRPSLVDQVSSELKPLPLWVVEVAASNRQEVLDKLTHILVQRHKHDEPALSPPKGT